MQLELSQYYCYLALFNIGGCSKPFEAAGKMGKILLDPLNSCWATESALYRCINHPCGALY